MPARDKSPSRKCAHTITVRLSLKLTHSVRKTLIEYRMEDGKDLGKSKHDDHENEDKDGQVAY